MEVDEISKSGEVFTLYLPVELWGHAEAAAETLEAGDEVMLTGRLKYKSVVDAKTQAKVSKLVVSSWGIAQRIPALTSPQVERSAAPEYSGQGDASTNAPEPTSAAPAIKARRPRPSTYLGKASALRGT